MSCSHLIIEKEEGRCSKLMVIAVGCLECLRFPDVEAGPSLMEKWLI